MSSMQMWKCEFCGTDNKVDIDVNEIPKSHEVTYLLRPACSSTSDSSIGSFSTGMDESILVFCIDISGSMCVTSEVIFLSLLYTPVRICMHLSCFSVALKNASDHQPCFRLKIGNEESCDISLSMYSRIFLILS